MKTFEMVDKLRKRLAWKRRRFTFVCFAALFLGASLGVYDSVRNGRPVPIEKKIIQSQRAKHA